MTIVRRMLLGTVMNDSSLAYLVRHLIVISGFFTLQATLVTFVTMYTAELLHQRGSVRHGGQKRGPISNFGGQGQPLTD